MSERILNDYEIVHATTGIMYDKEKQAIWFGATDRDREVAKAQDAKTDAEWREKVDAVVRHGRKVMQLLEEYGGSIVPHLMDNDENAGEYFRESLRQLEDTTP